jgi:hypothetical protein
LRNLTVGDLKLALRDLLGENLAQLRLTATGKLYEPRLRTKQQQIEAIPEAAGPLAPLAKELGETDVQHDGFGAASFYLCKAIEVHPTLPAALKQAAASVQKTFVPQLDILRAPYSDEASAALDNRPELVKLKAELKSIAAPGGGTLHDWIKSFIGKGDEIDKLLRQRATLLATGENAAATGPLRGATIGLLGRFRDALGDEIREDGGKIPADHDARLFAYIDKLNDDRALRGRTPAPAEPAAPPAEPVAADPALPQ